MRFHTTLRRALLVFPDVIMDGCRGSLIQALQEIAQLVPEAGADGLGPLALLDPGQLACQQLQQGGLAAQHHPNQICKHMPSFLMKFPIVIEKQTEELKHLKSTVLIQENPEKQQQGLAAQHHPHQICKTSQSHERYSRNVCIVTFKQHAAALSNAETHLEAHR